MMCKEEEQTQDQRPDRSKTVPDRSERTVTGAVDREPSLIRTSKFATGLRKFPNARTPVGTTISSEI